MAPALAVLAIAAAEPTGIAIAPAKQRRVRKIVLKVGALGGRKRCPNYRAHC